MIYGEVCLTSTAALFTLNGVIDGRDVTVLIDSGASANFLAKRIIGRVKLRGPDLNVRLADGTERTVYGEVRKRITLGMRNTQYKYECECVFKVMDLQARYQVTQLEGKDTASAETRAWIMAGDAMSYQRMLDTRTQNH